ACVEYVSGACVTRFARVPCVWVGSESFADDSEAGAGGSVPSGEAGSCEFEGLAFLCGADGGAGGRGAWDQWAGAGRQVLRIGDGHADGVDAPLEGLVW